MTLELKALMSELVIPRKFLFESDFQLESSGRLEIGVTRHQPVRLHKITQVTDF